jgi:hypothetical protein
VWTKTRFVTDVGEASLLSGRFSNHSELDDKSQDVVIQNKTDPDIERKKTRLMDALDEIGRYSIEYRMLADTVITDVFILPSELATSGSTSQAIGVIWANPRLSLSLHDFIELYVHEFTHNALFLDELRHRHYYYANIVDENTWATSAFLKKTRPLDKVFHSIIVGVEIVLLRDRLIGHPSMPRIHPPSGEIISQLYESIDCLEKVVLRCRDSGKELLRSRAFSLLDNAKTILKHNFGREGRTSLRANGDLLVAGSR